MQKKKNYKPYLRLMILSGIMLAITLTFTSLTIIRDGNRFTQAMLEENRTFLINTLRLGHGLMRHTGAENNKALINLATQSKFIRYLAFLDAGGNIIAQSDLTCPFPTSTELYPAQLKDGKILEETENIILISYRAGEIGTEGTFWGHDSAIERPESGLDQISWFLFALDVAAFKKHYYDMVSQTLVSASLFLLFGILVVVFFGITQRYELASLSINRLNRTKRVLGHFVPEAVKKMIEKDPDTPGLLNKTNRDATILFLDIEGFALLQGRYSQERINRTVEIYFSEFYNTIRENGGDVNETAGDGMMVIFLHDNASQQAQNAVRTALAIQAQCAQMSTKIGNNIFPIRVNIGINSGEVSLGSTKMSGTEAQRWTFTASGKVTNLAARLEQYAQGGQILIGRETARWVQGLFTVRRLGEVYLKNIKNSGEVFEVLQPQSVHAYEARYKKYQRAKAGDLK
jgi:class 3 adenylate cyclase